MITTARVTTRRAAAVGGMLALICGLVAPAPAATSETTGLRAEITESEITLGNGLVERTWSRSPFQTLSAVDLRPGGHDWGAPGPDFTLDLGPTTIDSTAFEAVAADVDEISNVDGSGLRLRIALEAPAISATRVVEVYEGVAGFRTRTILTPTVPLALFGYTLDELTVGGTVSPTIHAFRAGADWREPGWGGPALAIGDKHAGTWRDTQSAGTGQSLEGPAQWLSAARDGRSFFMVMERNDWPSSRATYDGTVASLEVDYSRELVMFGPFEEDVHAENPTSSPGRHRVLKPGTPFPLESSFVGFGSSPADEAWQFHKYLVEHRLDPYDHEVTFNSNGTDANVRSDGAKDDMVEEVVLEVAPKAKQLGIETFILDDGWQARSGDWHPDCWDQETGEQHTDPRWDGSEDSKFRPRFSDCSFEAVREAIAPMELGLWMTPMHFHPRSEVYQTHPEWACKPVGDAVGALSIVEPSGGSNDAGIGTWSTHPDLIRHVESRVQHAIDSWEVTYFKFDFLVWLDCVGQGDLYDYKEDFIAMVDRLIAANPDVTFEIDETNDYRLFPFESVTRGPSWFQNGSPSPDRLLHNLWNLSPYVPAWSLGQHFLGGRAYETHPVDSLMAVSLLSHMTFFSDLRHLPDAVVEDARPWIDFYKANRDAFGHVVYPLLDDPVENDWTALQSWDPEAGEGALLAFRQESADDRRTISLQNVPEGRSFELTVAPTGESYGTFTSQELTSGIEIVLPSQRQAQVLVIRPAEPEPQRIPTTLILEVDGNGSKRTLIATLADATDGTAIAGGAIEFFADGEPICRPAPLTDTAGTATCDPPPRFQGGPRDYEAIFRGDDHHLASADSGTG